MIYTDASGSHQKVHLGRLTANDVDHGLIDQPAILPLMAKQGGSFLKRIPPAALAGVVLVAIVGGGLLASAALRDETPEPAAAPSPGATPSPEGSVLPIPQSPSDVGVPLEDAGCTQVIEPKDQGAHQIGQRGEHPPYSSTPPTSGWYAAEPVPPALYYIPVPPEAALSTLVRGSVVVWHTGLTPAEEELLHGLFIYFEDEGITGASGEDLGLKEPIVLTAWGKLQRCDEISGEAIATFFTTYRGQGPLAGAPSGA